ncbi:MAG TPA: hypothetical protein ENK06_07470 [Gammaproteobacteria bacterium]|nr:hypothetical protein [Gammaproteobacteria bacterium]
MNMSNPSARSADFEGVEFTNPYKLQELTKALIKFSMQDGDRASQELSVRLSNIHDQFTALEANIDAGIDIDVAKMSIMQGMSELTCCLVELQFFDRISQRMDHAIQSLDAVSEDEATQAGIGGIFTMEDERILYSALIEGYGVEGAVQKVNADLVSAANDGEDDIELF